MVSCFVSLTFGFIFIVLKLGNILDLGMRKKSTNESHKGQLKTKISGNREKIMMKEKCISHKSMN